MQDRRWVVDSYTTSVDVTLDLTGDHIAGARSARCDRKGVQVLETSAPARRRRHQLGTKAVESAVPGRRQRGARVVRRQPEGHLAEAERGIGSLRAVWRRWFEVDPLV